MGFVMTDIVSKVIQPLVGSCSKFITLNYLVGGSKSKKQSVLDWKKYLLEIKKTVEQFREKFVTELFIPWLNTHNLHLV